MASCPALPSWKVAEGAGQGITTHQQRSQAPAAFLCEEGDPSDLKNLSCGGRWRRNPWPVSPGLSQSLPRPSSLPPASHWLWKPGGVGTSLSPSPSVRLCEHHCLVEDVDCASPFLWCVCLVCVCACGAPVEGGCAWPSPPPSALAVLSRHCAHIWSCGASGPYGGILCDGSEYTGSYGVGPVPPMTVEALMAFHRPRVAAACATSADLLAFETIPCMSEGVAIARLLAEEFPKTEAWISFSCRSENTLVCVGVGGSGSPLVLCSPPPPNLVLWFPLSGPHSMPVVMPGCLQAMHLGCRTLGWGTWGTTRHVHTTTKGCLRMCMSCFPPPSPFAPSCTPPPRRAVSCCWRLGWQCTPLPQPK
jgi:hypothetical protein